MSSKRILYGMDTSPPVRAVRMCLEELKLDYEYKLVNTHNDENKTPEYLKKNPQHTVPTLEEADGTCIWDSHAIIAYLARKYGNADELYPKDFYKRAVVDQRLHYDNSLFIGLSKPVVGGVLRGTAKKENLPEMFNSVTEQYALMETFLGDNQYIAGNKLTIADFSVVTALSALVCFLPVDPAKFPKLSAWFDRMKMLPYYEKANANGIEELKIKLKPKMAELQ